MMRPAPSVSPAGLLPADESGPITRCRILATAERSFREIGYQKTTVADIAKTLRMSPANVYRFFESKKAIHEAVVARVTGEIEALVAAIAEAPGLSATERLRGAIEALYRDTAERWAGHPRLHEMIEAATTETWEVCRRHMERMVLLFERILRDGIAGGEFAAQDPAVAARCVQTAILRYSHPLLVSQIAQVPAPSLDEMIAFLLRSLRPDAAYSEAAPASGVGSET